MLSKKLIVPIIIVLFLLPIFPIQGKINETNMDLKLNPVYGESSDVLIGTILNKESKKVSTDDISTIITIVEVETENPIKGNTKKSDVLTIGYLGGTVDGISMEVHSTYFESKNIAVGDKIAFYTTKTISKQSVFYKQADLIAYDYKIIKSAQNTVNLLRAVSIPDAIDGYTLVGFDYEGTHMWDVDDCPINYKINNNTDQCTGEFTAVGNAFEAWEGVSYADEPYFNAPTTSTVTTHNAFDGENTVLWVSQNYYENTMGRPSSEYGCCYVYAVGEISGFDIIFNNGKLWDINDPNAYDVQNCAAHEAGHAVGLGDVYASSLDDITMYKYAYYGETQKRTIAFDDILGVRYVYPDSSYPKPSASITSPSDQSYIDKPLRIYASTDTSGISTYQCRITSATDEDYDSGWMTMTSAGSGVYYVDWNEATGETDFWITVRFMKTNGQYNYASVEVYD